tara:strand:- start:327 stop:752 length:426 start_codon:yes stop_codon:yes gene_type:complete
MYKLSFIVYGQPVAKSRPRFNMKTGNVYTPQKTVDYETRVRQAAWVAMSKHKYKIFDGNCSVEIKAFLSIPKSWTKQKKFEAELGKVIPSKPDIDNIAKSILDGAQGVTFKDDKQIFHLAITKRYQDEDTKPQVQVSIFWE